MSLSGAALGAFLDQALRLFPLVIALTLSNNDRACQWQNNVWTPVNETKFDFIVVGSGPGGSALAGRLAEENNWDVLVLEAGGILNPIAWVPGFPRAFSGEGNSIRWPYLIQPQSDPLISSFYYGRPQYNIGKVLGGSNAIGGTHLVRGNKNDYDFWESLGNEGWGYDDVLPYFIKSETYIGDVPAELADYHGTDGPMPVQYIETAAGAVFQDAVLDSTTERDSLLARNNDYNAFQQVGAVSKQPRQIQNGVRENVADSYLLPKIVAQDNLKVSINSLATKIIFKNFFNKVIAEGIEYEYNGEKYVAYAKKEVILSAGGINSPQLLMLSGIGNKDELEALGIESVVDLPGVGENLVDHPFSINQFYLGDFDHPLSHLLDTSAVLQYLQTKTGVYSERPSHSATIMANIGGDDPNWADLQMVVNIASTNYLGDASDLITGWMSPAFQEYFNMPFGGTFGSTVVLLRPYSRGKVSLASSDYSVAPIIDHRMLSDPRDAALMGKAMNYSSYVLTGSALSSRGVSQWDKVVPGCESETYLSTEYWECVGKVFLAADYHVVGTVKMGTDTDPLACVDNELKVRGVKDLRVVDASIMPYIVSGNTYSACVMIGEKAADAIKAEHCHPWFGCN